MSKIVLQKYSIHFDAANARGRCLAHATNLAAQSFLSVLSQEPNSKLEELFGRFDVGIDDLSDELTQEYEAETETINLDDVTANPDYFTEESLSDLGISLSDLNGAVKKVRSS